MPLTITHSAASIRGWFQNIPGVFVIRPGLVGANAAIGWAVDVNDTANIAAFSALTGGSNTEGSAGSVYIYESDGSFWTQRSQIFADAFEGINFGRTLQLSSTGNRIVIAGPTGRWTYIFVRSGNSWVREDRFRYVAPGYSLGYGADAVTISGDGDHVITTSTTWNGTGNANGTRGAAIYYYRDAFFGWTLGQLIVPPDTGDFMNFGQQCSMSADGNWLAITSAKGTFYYTSSNLYIFEKVSGTWTYRTTITGNSGEKFSGCAVSLNTDGTVLTVGADPIYVFTRSGNIWTQQTTLFATGGTTNSYLGKSISINGTGNVFIAGAPLDSTIASNGGQSYIFANANTWSQVNTLSNVNLVANNYFGWSVATNSAANIAIIGAPSFDGINRGAALSDKVYIFTNI